MFNHVSNKSQLFSRSIDDHHPCPCESDTRLVGENTVLRSGEHCQIESGIVDDILCDRDGVTLQFQGRLVELLRKEGPPTHEKKMSGCIDHVRRSVHQHLVRCKVQ